VALRLQSSSSVRRRCLLLAIALAVVGCATRRMTTMTTTIVDDQEEEPTATTTAAINPVSVSVSDTTTLETARACATVASSEACVTCCDFSNAAKEDILACIAGARCEAKPAKKVRKDDCRTTGCGDGLRCEACWTRWTCVGEGVHC
jgi:hypothetical protein